jgi:hypothetical protein
MSNGMSPEELDNTLGGGLISSVFTLAPLSVASAHSGSKKVALGRCRVWSPGTFKLR